MNRKETYYQIYTAPDMDKERLQSWKIPRIVEEIDIKKQELIEIINIELQKGNFTGAIDILKESFKRLNMEQPAELINLESGKTTRNRAYRENALLSAALSSMEKLIENEKYMGEDDFKNEQNIV